MTIDRSIFAVSWWAGGLLCFAFSCFSLDGVAGEVWEVLSDRSMEVPQGAVLDFSSIPLGRTAGGGGWAIAGEKGDVRFAREDQAQRFLCASIVPSPPNGGLPDKTEADKLVAQLRRTGYNLVRLHYVDASLMHGRKKDFDFDPVALDRLHYLMAKMRSVGIYWVVDGLTSENGAYGDVQPHRWVNKHQLLTRLYHDPEALEHWKRLVSTLWGGVNPYTGLPPIQDPAMLGMILVNEGGLAFRSTLSGHYPPELKAPFANWLAKRYEDESAFRLAWRGEVSARDRFGVAVEVPGELRERGPRGRDFAAFAADIEAALAKEMEAHVRALGFKGLVTSYNNWTFYSAFATRSGLGWVDMHAYQSLPSNSGSPGSRMPQTSLFDDAGKFGRTLANARQWGKPFTVTEYGHPFWNQWRFESAAWLPAMAAFQGWDAICQFAESPVLLRYSDAGPPRHRAMYPFGVGADPIARGAERLAALLFLRGDVTPSRIKVKLALNPSGLFEEGMAWRQVPEGPGRLALLGGVGLAVDGLPVEAKGANEAVFDLHKEAGGLMGTLADKAAKEGFTLGNDMARRLKALGLLPTDNRSDFGKGVFESDTGQILFDSATRRVVVNTPRTVAITRRSGDETAGDVTLNGLSGPATVAVGAVDAKEIRSSGRMLVWVLTDAMNSDMEFADAERTTLKRLGRFPVRVRVVRGRLTLRHENPGALKVWAVDQAGRRVAAIPNTVGDGRISFPIDNLVPNHGPVTYFEVAVQ